MAKETTLTNVETAVSEYREANKDGMYSPRYGKLMLDRSTGEVWTDEFYSLGHNEWKEYHNKAIINLGSLINENGENVTVDTANEYGKKAVAEYETKQRASIERD